MSEGEVCRPEVDTAQKIRVQCSIYEYALTNSVSSYVNWSEFTAALGAIASFVYLALFAIWHSNEKFAYALGVIQSLLSALLFCVTLVTLFRRWQSKQEYQQSLAFKYADLLKRVEVDLIDDCVTERKAKIFNKEFQELEIQRKNDKKGEMSQRFIQKGHRHTAKKYRQLHVTCFECDRAWEAKFEQRVATFFSLKAWKFWQKNYCNNCGVELDE